MYIVAWPESVIDVEISPRRIGVLAGAQRLSAGGCELYLVAGDGAPGVARLVRGGVLMEARLPAGAHDARVLETSDGRIMLLGRCDAGEFAQIYDATSGTLALDVWAARSPAERGGVQVFAGRRAMRRAMCCARYGDPRVGAMRARCWRWRASSPRLPTRPSAPR